MYVYWRIMNKDCWFIYNQYVIITVFGMNSDTLLTVVL